MHAKIIFLLSLALQIICIATLKLNIRHSKCEGRGPTDEGDDGVSINETASASAFTSGFQATITAATAAPSATSDTTGATLLPVSQAPSFSLSIPATTRPKLKQTSLSQFQFAPALTPLRQAKIDEELAKMIVDCWTSRVTTSFTPVT